MLEYDVPVQPRMFTLLQKSYARMQADLLEDLDHDNIKLLLLDAALLLQTEDDHVRPEALALSQDRPDCS